ncbi:palmitoyltransferase ZDHHC12-B-like isoform X2 [Salvia hispanica]|uniref:palmitoyltransferase ZDHHC12-B-like isoform X2 n=1 Tax=Salvia hispanica TaxID=49212 RepID=UPI002009D555|nr:palmitoyltransferase ZDHHC12-B-like isoform X2 [Salvia hispanica]
MLEPEEEIIPRHNPKWNKSSTVSCLVSLISVSFTHFSFSLLPFFLPASSFLSLLPLSAVLLVLVMGLGRLCKRVAGVRASAPAFVFFSILFVWAIYITVVRRVISSLLDIVMNIEMIMVLIGLCCIMLSDPGILTHHSCAHLSVRNSINEIESHGEELKVSTSVAHQESPAEEEFSRYRRVRYCRYCKNYVMGLDHHCPAFGNCIGQRNHALFIVLVVGFAISEASFVVCASYFMAKSETSKFVGEKLITSRNLVVGTALFCVIQVVWQINWKNYPEFRSKVVPHEGQPHPDAQFINPYDKGILRNLKEFFATDAYLPCRL